MEEMQSPRPRLDLFDQDIHICGVNIFLGCLACIFKGSLISPLFINNEPNLHCDSPVLPAQFHLLYSSQKVRIARQVP